jgi:hypothetical protein
MAEARRSVDDVAAVARRQRHHDVAAGRLGEHVEAAAGAEIALAVDHDRGGGQHVDAVAAGAELHPADRDRRAVLDDDPGVDDDIGRRDRIADDGDQSADERDAEREPRECAAAYLDGDSEAVEIELEGGGDRLLQGQEGAACAISLSVVAVAAIGADVIDAARAEHLARRGIGSSLLQLPDGKDDGVEIFLVRRERADGHALSPSLSSERHTRRPRPEERLQGVSRRTAQGACGHASRWRLRRLLSMRVEFNAQIIAGLPARIAARCPRRKSSSCRPECATARARAASKHWPGTAPCR